ncbi:MAG TPA: hypothetical protein VGL57_13400 [Solirubrobacteraceae bacterium]|jgi:hypothetical protein
MAATLTPAQSAVPIFRITSTTAFLRDLLADASNVRHQEIRWTTEAVTEIGDHRVAFKALIAGYIAERDGQLTVIELRDLCGAIADDRRTEEIRATEQMAASIERLETAAAELGLDLRQGRFTLDPSPLMPTQEDVLRSFCPTFTSLAGSTYSAWTDGWGVGLECVRNDGLCTYLYVEPGQETDDGRACVFCHLGKGGDPTEDVVQHAYDPFDPDQLARVYTVLTANGERNWTADDPEHARRQHEESFGGEPGETIEDVYLTRSEQQANLPRTHIDSAAPDEAILDGMMRLAQRLSCGHPQSPYIDVIAALRRVKEASRT